ncbi:MAG: DUF2200 domain-containing protein [Comamonadaceae bacterium]|nr:DUF2200 domain-containing protein [Comamonadaceae bacterium]
MSEHRIFSTAFAKVYPLYVQKAERKGRTRAEVAQRIRGMKLTSTVQAGKRGHRRVLLAFAFALASLSNGAWTPAHAADCSPDVLSSLLLAQQPPVGLFANPNGNPLTPAELDEIQGTIANIRSTLGRVSSLAALKNPSITRSLDITVGANVKLNGYAFSPKTYDAHTEKVGKVVITFATDHRAGDCRVFWMRVSLPATGTPSNPKDGMKGA